MIVMCQYRVSTVMNVLLQQGTLVTGKAVLVWAGIYGYSLQFLLSFALNLNYSLKIYKLKKNKISWALHQTY